jgi:glycine C-acetyltransferase
MRPYQVHLFTNEEGLPESLPSAPYFTYEDKRWLNFSSLDCFNLRGSELTKEVVKSNIDTAGIGFIKGRTETLKKLENLMSRIKKFESLMIFPDEFALSFALFSIFGQKSTFFIDYETSPSIITVLQNHNVEYYSHHDPNQLNKLLSARSERVLIVDGLYEWTGTIAPASELLDIAKANECIIIANELSSFGLLGREGRGFVDLFNLYDEINIEIGSFSKILGGFGSYIGMKKYLINKIKENIYWAHNSLPQFMLAVNLLGIESMAGRKKKLIKLWKNSRYFITGLKQRGFKTKSDTPIVIVNFNNNNEAIQFQRELFPEQVIVDQYKEKIRLGISIEHSKEDLEFVLEKFETVGKDLGIL